MIQQTTGHIVKLHTANDKHHDGKIKRDFQSDDVSSSFANALNKAIGKVNDLQIDSEKMAEKMIYAPEEVDIHSVMISAQKAEVALSFTKAVRDEAIRAYRELVNLR